MIPNPAFPIPANVPAGKRAEDDEILTNAAIIDLVKKKMGDTIIVEMIGQSSKCSFRMGPSSIGQLKAAGVSDSVMTAMQKKTKK